MKKTILTFSLLVLMASFTTATAQQDVKKNRKELKAEMTPEQQAQKKTDRMTKSLALDEKQQEEMFNINLKHAKEQAKLREERKALKAKIQAEKRSCSADIDNTLTEEQKAKLKELKAKKAEQKSKNKHPKPPKPPVK